MTTPDAKTKAQGKTRRTAQTIPQETTQEEPLYPPGGSVLELRGVSKEFRVRDQPVRALDDVNLRVLPGEFLCVVGASGSGKSTLLSLIAGLQRPTEGEINLGGKAVTGPSPERGLVFQAASLFPWRTVEENVAFGLELIRLSKSDRMQRVQWYLQEIDLLHLRKALPKQLSGGQQQRVAIARALACEPDVLLLDEPFGALDVQTKEDMHLLVRKVWRDTLSKEDLSLMMRKVWHDTSTTVLMVTHDVEEAVFLGQRVIVLASDPGRIVEDIPVKLPDERDLAVKRSPEFLALRAKVEDLVRSQHRSHLARTGR